MKQDEQEKLQKAVDQFSGEDWEQREQETPFWKPEEIGDSIQGTLKKETEAKHGPAFLIIDEEGEERMIGDYETLGDDLRELLEQEQELEIGIIYTGMDSGDKGPYNTFKLFTKSEETPSAS